MEFAGRTKPIANIFLPAFRAFSMVGVCRFESVQPPSPSGNVLSGPVWGGVGIFISQTAFGRGVIQAVERVVTPLVKRSADAA